ncbi:MAG: hypothetical protein IBX64_03940 [Actinobacteria bacterium]|nr:hypothetical protein [Actinomycetota bacterium]
MRLLKLIVKAGGKRGVGQGAVLSPLLSNVLLNELEKDILRRIKGCPVVECGVGRCSNNTNSCMVISNKESVEYEQHPTGRPTGYKEQPLHQRKAINPVFSLLPPVYNNPVSDTYKK